MSNKNAVVPIIKQQPLPFRLEETERGLVLSAHGQVQNVEEYSKLINDLNTMSKKHSIIEVFISGPGGSADTLIELGEVLSKYETVVTICNSSASSASAMLWSIGTVRVCSPFASLMWHRESYGFFGKTTQHEDFLEKQKKLFPIILDEFCGEVLTQEDADKAMYTEVYYTGQELIDRDLAVPFTEYEKNRDACFGPRFSSLGQLVVDNKTGQHLIVDDEGYANSVGQIAMSEYKYSIFDMAVSHRVRVKSDEGTVNLNRVEFEETEDNFISQFEDTGEEVTTEDYPNPSEDPKEVQ